MLENLTFDLRLAYRGLRTDRRVSVASILALALGIGSSTIAFSVFYNVLLEPFPYKGSNRLVTFSIQNLANSGGSTGRNFFSASEFKAFREENHVFEDTVAYNPAHSVLYSDGIGTRVLPGLATVTSNTFEFYGVSSLLGRTLTAEDAKPGSPPVFVMNYRLWRSEFDGDPALLGKSFILDGQPRTLVGIMPPRFDIYRASIWAPEPAGAESGEIVGRLKPGIRVETAAADLDVIAHRLTSNEQFALNPEKYAVVVTKLIDAAVGSFDKALYVLLATVFMLLLIACTNVANLLLARGITRGREVAIRTALGASRRRIIQQFVAESFLLSAAACLLGWLIAYFGLKLVVAILPQDAIPGEAVIGMNSRVLLFAITITALTTLLCSLAPMLHALKNDSRLGLAAKRADAVEHGRLRSVLVVAEVALSVVLVTGAGLLMRNFLALTQVELPFDPAKTLYAELALPQDRYYGKPDRKPAFFDQLLPRVAQLPGVISVSETLMLPPDEGSWTDVDIPGKPHTERWTTDIELCTQGYFQTLGLQLQQGRLFSQDDLEAHRHVTVVNKELARKYFDGRNPIGRKIKFEVLDRPFLDAPHNAYFEIVGVVSDFETRPEGAGYNLMPEAFLPASVAGFGNPLHIIAKTAQDPQVLLKSVYHEVAAIDPSVGFSHSGSIEDLLHNEFSAPRFEFVALSAFAAIGLLLMVIGVFSVMTYFVSSRTHEIGVRMALGAERASVLKMVWRKGMALVSSGIVVGLFTGLGLSGFLGSILWGTRTADPWTFALSIGIILISGSVACFLPARRATRVDPLVMLRYE